MSTAEKIAYTADQYLRLDRESDVKHEFFGGEIFARAGGSEAHNLIVGNLVREIGGHLKKRPCKVYPSDMRVKIAATGLYTYPDVTVACEPVEFEDAANGKKDVLLNPRVLFEVPSESTEAYDRGKKFEHYRKLDSLHEYVIIAQDHPHIDHYRRQADGTWLLLEVSGLDDVLRLGAIDGEVPMAEIFDKVEFAAVS